MYGEIDLETYTLAILRLNNALEKLETSPDEVKGMFEESLNDLERIYHDTVDDLNRDEVNVNEYYLFFQHGKQTFPQYIDVLGRIDNEELVDVVNGLLNVFNNLNKIAEGFKGNDLNEFG